MFIRDFAVSVAVGIILLLLLSRLIGRVQFSLSTAFWCSFIGHTFVCIIGWVISAIIGFAFPQHDPQEVGATLLIGLPIGCFCQAVLFQIAVRAKNATLTRWRSVILSLIVILGDWFVASPLIELWEHFHK
jgi:hypothetical protein